MALLRNDREGYFMQTKPYSVRVYTPERGDFSALQNRKVLIYFPHGFGDWVQFSYITRFLHPSNRYWITRFGDDNTSLFEGHEMVVPLYLGSNSTHGGDGNSYGNRHFGLDYGGLSGDLREMRLPIPLWDVCVREEIDTVLWNGFPEAWGACSFPFHTKPRHQLPLLSTAGMQDAAVLEQPLQSSLNFHVAPEVTRWVEARLKSFTGWTGKKLCLICRNGYTAVGKNWGHMFREDREPKSRIEGEECRDFMRLMLRKDTDWVFIVMEDRMFQGEHTVRDPYRNCYSYAELFGEPGESTLPFAWIMKALVNCADLSIGVPAGPYHLSMAKKGLPTVGLWIEHLPSWYDEPKTESIHLISRNVEERGFMERPGSFFERDGLKFNFRRLDTRTIEAEQVLEAVEFLMS